MRIALILFGQPRYIDNPACINSHKEFIYSQGEVDVYSHIWEPTGISYATSSWSGITHCPSSDTDTFKFVEKWKPFISVSENEKSFENPEIFKLLKDKFPNPHWNETDFNKALSHLYSLEKAITYFENEVAFQNADYDFVIVTRPDVCIWDFPKLSELPKDKFYISSLFHPEHFADVCFIMDPKFVKGLKAYSYLTDPNGEIFTNMSQPSAEQFKKETFLKHFSWNDVLAIPIPVRIVRDNLSKGTQW